MAKTDRTFEAVAFTAAATLDERDLSDCLFVGCTFDLPAVRGADFSGARFKDCRFSPGRFASCKFPGARFQRTNFFDAEQKKGCTFAF